MRKDVDRTVKGAVAHTPKELFGAEAAIAAGLPVQIGNRKAPPSGLFLERAIP